MDISTILIYGIWIVVALSIFLLIKGWVTIYNKFQYWVNRAKRKFADIEVYMQERLDNIHVLSQIVKKYDIHEYKALKDVIEARSRWTKDATLNEKVKFASQIDSNLLKLEAVFEKYPQLKAEKLHHKIFDRDSQIEKNLRTARLGYNRVAQQYNERVSIFPRNIVAWFHHFKMLDYLAFENRQGYNPKEIFND